MGLIHHYTVALMLKIVQVYVASTIGMSSIVVQLLMLHYPDNTV